MSGLQTIRTSTALRYVLTGLILGCIIVCATGEYLATAAIRHNIRREVKNRLRADISVEELTIIAISKMNPPKTFARRNAREIRYQGGMYDIVREEQHGDSTVFYCLFDERETALEENVEQQARQELAHNPNRQQQQRELLQKIPKFFFLHTNLFSYGFKCSPEKPVKCLPILADRSPEILSPPPDGRADNNNKIL